MKRIMTACAIITAWAMTGERFPATQQTQFPMAWSKLVFWYRTISQVSMSIWLVRVRLSLPSWPSKTLVGLFSVSRSLSFPAIIRINQR